MNRRNFLRTSGALAVAATATPSSLAASTKSVASAGRSFPRDFIWGSATAAYQVEGAVHEDGRGLSIWDTFSHLPGRVANNDTGDVADDHYHRYKEDVALMKRIGIKAYRFSIAWPRVFPVGTGAPNPKGLDFYERLLDELQTAGIEPYCTLFHWDLPQALQDKGGWTNRTTANAFADYSGFVAARLSDRIHNWMTVNEIGSYIDSGYGPTSNKAPNMKLGRAELMQTRHYAVLAHGLAVQSIRAAAKHPVRIGLAHDLKGAMPAIETHEHIVAAEKAMRAMNAPYAAVILEGRYSDAYLAALGADAPRFTAEELKTISSPIDFFGANVYTTTSVMAADNEAGYLEVPRPASYPRMNSPWLYVAPEALYWTPRLMAKVWNVKEILITENGCSCNDTLHEGKVLDTDRVMFLRQYLTQLQRCVSENVPVKGYFLWSLLDNYEWTDGYSKRFGIHYVDFETQKRTPKLSADFYRMVIAQNGLA
ncbi:MAG: GH1 family beta-glucosidase [Acidobacteriaceae bacterium]|nr:GH1 family beta-glucosidase [Acidobacteriaceae bacterium]